VTLLDALNQKFGISSSKAHLLSQVHLPQLFLAMQYHTGTRFQDAPGAFAFRLLVTGFASLLTRMRCVVVVLLVHRLSCS
jgi:hypothetical protein